MVAEFSNQEEWFTAGMGRLLHELEVEEFKRYLPNLYGYHIVQIGQPALSKLLSCSAISHRILINPKVVSQIPCSVVKGAIDELPLQSESVDVVILAHILEKVRNPHQVLKEAHRVLIPGGHVIISGLNPISQLGIWYGFSKLLGKIEPGGTLLSSRRIADWLKLLEFQVIDGRPFFYRPPLKSHRIMNRLMWMEAMGRKLFHPLGGAYTVVAVKRVVPMTTIRPKLLKSKIWASNTEVAGA